MNESKKRYSTSTPKSKKDSAPNGLKALLAATGQSISGVDYTLNCGHKGNALAVVKRDLIFCKECGSTKTVKSVSE
jgi:hypothetical protein